MIEVLFGVNVGKHKEGTIAKVANGYARNFLLPKRLVKLATKQVKKEHEDKRRAMEYHDSLELENSKRIMSMLEGKIIEAEIGSGDFGKSFGSITSKNVCDIINEKFNLTVDKKKVSLEIDEIKSPGRYSATIKLHKNVIVTVHVDVSSKPNSV